jgi:2-oxo-4-hydroxy-4-carboxy-5-ureidoimidazoline decarboxylase
VITLTELNGLPQPEFVALLGGVFEHSPWVAERAARARPFASVPQLLEAMRTVVECATPAEQLTLIRAHPQLGPRAGAPRVLTDASQREQRGAGLSGVSAAEAARLGELNAQYLQKFGFPFILAVRGHDPASILAALTARLAANAAQEQGTALQQIGLIAGYRLAELIH